MDNKVSEIGVVFGNKMSRKWRPGGTLTTDKELLELTIAEINVLGKFCLFEEHLKNFRSEKGERIDQISVTRLRYDGEKEIRSLFP